MKHTYLLVLSAQRWTQLLYVGVILVIVISLNSGCVDAPQYPADVKSTLDESGENRKELLSVIKHFSKDSANHLKLDAALYLIKNMKYHQARYSEDDFKDTFKKLGEAKDKDSKTRESIQREFDLFDLNKANTISDSKFITSSFLINSINAAFEAWRSYPWCKQMSYEDFKTYILPYRISSEPLEEYRDLFRKKYAWVLDSIKNPTDMSEAFTLIYNSFYSEYKTTGAWKYRIPTKYSEFIAAKTGLCEDAANTLGMALRSMGIKCNFDYSVQWGNQAPNAHSWISYPASKSLTYIIEKEKILKSPEHVHSGKFDIEEPGSRFIKDNITVEEYKRGTKVRRCIFEVNPNSIVVSESTSNTVIKFNDICNIDITTLYIKTSDFSINLAKPFHESKVLYLGIFNGLNFNIVDVAKITNGEVFFSNVGLDNIYFPLVYEESEFKPVSHPFALKDKGQKEFFIADTSKKQTLKLRRKYPLLGYTLNNANFLFHGQFQGANSPDFNDATELFKVEHTYLFPTEITVKDQHKFRFVRFIPDSSRKLSIAEISYTSIDRGKEEQITGEAITNVAGETVNVSDNDFTTTFHKDRGAWIGIDLGEGRGKRIHKIKFCPRTDTNFTMPGNEYQLYYWDNGWILFQTKRASDYEISFDNVPVGVLFWLHCNDGGREERPFTYENSRQIWW
ncbi:MAG: transglutaminase domain-containing protein [Niabella sp.]